MFSQFADQPPSAFPVISRAKFAFLRDAGWTFFPVEFKDRHCWKTGTLFAHVEISRDGSTAFSRLIPPPDFIPVFTRKFTFARYLSSIKFRKTKGA